MNMQINTIRHTAKSYEWPQSSDTVAGDFSIRLQRGFLSNNRKAAIPINGTITMESAHINGEAQMRQSVF